MTSEGVDRQTALILSFAGGHQAVLHTALDTRGPNRAAIMGTHGRSEIDEVWYTPTTFTRFDGAGAVVERFSESVTGRGMQYQAWEAERLISAHAASTILPPEQTIRIRETLDTIREQIGLNYPEIDA